MEVRVGAQIHRQQASYAQMRDAWLRVEEMGADTLFNWDHFSPLYGDRDGEHFECWTLLGAMAGVTERVEFGVLVTCNSYRNANLLADMARTVVSHLGRQAHPRDRRRLVPERLRRVRLRVRDGGRPSAGTQRSMPVIEERLRKLNPLPLRDPLPILIGGGGENVTLRIVAQHAHPWNGFGDPDQAGRKSRILDDWCERVGAIR